MSPVISTLAAASARGYGGLGASVDLDLSAYFPIATTTLTTAAASVTFSGIPATYTHLQIRTMCLTSASATDVKAQFNGDTGSNYALHLLWGNGSAASAGAYTAQTYAVAGITSITTANPAAGVIDILDYANTNKNTTVRTLSGSDTNGVGGFIFLESGLWLNTAAITSIVLSPFSGTFNQYSSFTLYGIKG